jgi:hypothetical protein
LMKIFESLTFRRGFRPLCNAFQLGLFLAMVRANRMWSFSFELPSTSARIFFFRVPSHRSYLDYARGDQIGFDFFLMRICMAGFPVPDEILFPAVEGQRNIYRHTVFFLLSEVRTMTDSYLAAALPRHAQISHTRDAATSVSRSPACIRGVFIYVGARPRSMRRLRAGPFDRFYKASSCFTPRTATVARNLHSHLLEHRPIQLLRRLRCRG